MKATLLVFISLFFSTRILSQSGIIQPELFRIPTPASLFEVCTDSNKGKVFLMPEFNLFSYCYGANAYKQPIEKWGVNNFGIHYLGKVGFGISNPGYELQTFTNTRFQTLIVDEKIGINTSTPTEKLELKDREIAFMGPDDVQKWRLRNLDISDRFEFLEDGQTKMIINYGGNIRIGDVPSTDKLSVAGNVSYAGGLAVEGKGILSNSNATQLVMHTFNSMTTSNILVVQSNACAVLGISFPVSTFTTAPAIFLGRNISNNPVGQNLIKSITNVTTTSAQIRICNTTGNDVAFTNQSFSVIVLEKL